MTTFLARNGMDLAIAAVTAPLASYGLHQMFPAPDVRFIAVASTLNLYVYHALRNFNEHSINQAAKRYGHESNQVFVRSRFYHLLDISTFYLLPIFIKSIGQRVGIQAPDYLPLIGYIGLANGAFWVTKCCIEIIEQVYYKPTTK